MNKRIAGLSALVGSLMVVACGADATTPAETASQTSSQKSEPAKTDVKATKDAAKTPASGLKDGTTKNAAGQQGCNGRDGDGVCRLGNCCDEAGGGQNGQNGQNGQGGRVSVNDICCFNGQFLKCPNSAACFGGFDVDACQERCGGNFDCEMDCVSKLSSAGPPVGCAPTAPVPGISCGN